MRQGRRTGPDPEGRVAAVLTCVLVGFGLWRVRQGVDMGDGAHVVALAVRMAEGDVPLADELNMQALGSLAAVPFTWVWLHVYGLEGVVLASRLAHLALVVSVAALGYAALRTGVRPLPALTAVVLTSVPTPYNLLVTSYNTVPGLMLGLATFAGYAALARSSARWAAVAGVGLVVAVLSHPSALPGAALLGAVLLALALGLRRGRAARGLLLGASLASAAVVVGILAGPGLGSLLTTLDYTVGYQSTRLEPPARLARTASIFGSTMVSPPYLPVLALAALACPRRVPPRWRAVAAVMVPVAAALPALVRVGEREHVGGTSGTYAVIVTLALLVPVTLDSLRRADRELRLLLALAAPGLVGLLAYGALTNAHPSWGSVVPPVAPLYGVVGMGVVSMVATAFGTARGGSAPEGARRTVSISALVAVLLLVSSLLAIHTLRSFRDPAPWIASAAVAEGPNAGLRTTADRAATDCRWRVLLDAWVGPDEGLMAYGLPAAYLYAEGPMDTPIVWLGDFGAANIDAVAWLDRTGRWPDVVVVQSAVAGAWEPKAATDPLLARLAADYGTPQDVDEFFVLRRDGATTPPRPLGDLAACG